jgi:uncharacterized protein YcfJ
MSTPNMKSLVIGVVSVLAVGGIAVASYGGLGSGPRAEVLSSEAIRVTEPVFAEVLKVTPVQEQRPVSRQQCSERTVQRRAPERFGDKDGMVVGAVVGGLLGNQVGGGSGRAAATAAGVLAGGAIGKEADRRHTGGRRYEERVQDCRQVQDSETVVVGYDVDYRGETGQAGPGRRARARDRLRRALALRRAHRREPSARGAGQDPAGGRWQGGAGFGALTVGIRDSGFGI